MNKRSKKPTNYIEFLYDYRDHYKPYVVIHNNGKRKIVTNQKNVQEFLQVAYKHGYNIVDQCTIVKNAQKITKEYDRRIKKKQRLQILGNITKKMVLSKENQLIGKVVVTASLMAVLATNLTNPRKVEAHLDREAPMTPDQYMSLSNYEELEAQREQKKMDEIKRYLEEEYNVTSRSASSSRYEQAKEVKETPAVETKQEVKEEKTEVKQEVKEDKQSQLNTMLNAQESFSYKFEDRSNSTNISNAKQYEKSFEKYAKMYGLDKDLLIAIAAQESRGDHYKSLSDKKPGAGLMQIEKSVFLNHNVSAYNFDTKKTETIKVTEDTLKNPDTNIKVGAMILRGCMEGKDYNIPLAVQTYNMGTGNMAEVLKSNGKVQGPSDNSWLDDRSVVDQGDAKYVEHVFSYLGQNKKVEVQKRDGTKVSINLVNEQTNNLQR